MYLLEQDLAACRDPQGTIVQQDNSDDCQADHGKRVDPVEPSRRGIPDIIDLVLLGWHSLRHCLLSKSWLGSLEFRRASGRRPSLQRANQVWWKSNTPSGPFRNSTLSTTLPVGEAVARIM